MRNGIGLFIKPLVTNGPGLLGANDDKKALREDSLTVYHGRSTNAICTCIASGCEVPVGLDANNSQCIMQRSHLRPSHPIGSSEDSRHNAAFSPLAHTLANRTPGTPHSQEALKRRSC